MSFQNCKTNRSQRNYTEIIYIFVMRIWYTIMENKEVHVYYLIQANMITNTWTTYYTYYWILKNTIPGKLDKLSTSEIALYFTVKFRSVNCISSLILLFGITWFLWKEKSRWKYILLNTYNYKFVALCYGIAGFLTK